MRCSRELPTCARCSRLAAVCEFPAPPDRKVLATLRAQPKKRKADQTHQVRSPSISQPEVSHMAPLNHFFHVGSNESTSTQRLLSTHDVRLSKAVEQLLQDIYFDCMFNSTLVFHRPTFSRTWQEGRVAQHVLLAVYATATMYGACVMPNSCSTFLHVQFSTSYVLPRGAKRKHSPTTGRHTSTGPTVGDPCWQGGTSEHRSAYVRERADM